MLHTIAFHNAALVDTDGLKALTPVTDTIFATSGTGLLLPSDLKLVGAYAGSGQILRARVNAPSLLRVGFPSVRPVMQNASVSGAPTADPNMMVLAGSALTLRANEPVGVDAATFNTSSERAVGLLWLADRIDPIPAADSFVLRFTTTATVVTGQIGTWVVATPVFDQAFPSGTYAVTGLEFTAPGAIAARVIFPGSLYRPGVLAQPGTLGAASVGATRTAQCFYDGSFGVFGTFQTSAPPSIEVLTGATASTGTMEGYLKVVRTGDVGAAPNTPSNPMPSTSSLSALTRR